MQITQNPLVSICCVTYNHIHYITDCIEGFLMQETDFTYEIIINDDCSTDGTTEKLITYQNKYPEIIRLVLHNENEWQQGKRAIFARNTFPIARGKYIALCEGDDYWTDPLKLQKQVTLLENNPQYSGCFHNTAIFKNEKDELKPFLKKINYNELSQSDLIETPTLFGHTSSLLFKNTFEKLIPENFKKVVCDRILGYLVAENGNWAVINESMSCYRQNEGGVYALQEKINQLYFLLGVYEAIYSDKKSREKYETLLRNKLSYYHREIATFYKQLKRKKTYIKHLLKYIQFEKKDFRLLKIILKEEILKKNN